VNKDRIVIDGVPYIREDVAARKIGEKLFVREVLPRYFFNGNGYESAELGLIVQRYSDELNRMPGTRFRPGMKIRVAIVDDRDGLPF